jgi:RimJ/RimL family protein N-acetyltransferase
MLQLRTERLLLVAATLELVEAELHGLRHLGERLGAHVPPHWPPPLNDEQSLRWVQDYLRANPTDVGWASWYFLHRERGRLEAVGNGGFRGRPDAQGTVEIGYSILPDQHRLGFAPEAVRALVDWAFAHPAVERIRAQTYPDLRPSIRVLEKCGFAPAGPGDEPDALAFELPRERHRPQGARRLSN